MKVSRFLPKAVIIIVIVTSLLLSACTCNKQIEAYTIADSTGDWGFPSPYAHYPLGPGYVRMSFIFETLVWKNETEFVPQLASDWSYNADDNSYTFELQENVKWHDGTDFTANDVVFTFNYIKEHPYQWVDDSIVESAEALDSYTVKLCLSEQYAPFLQDVASTQPILPNHIWESVTVPEEFQDAEAVIGTGPYKLADYSKEHGTYLYQANDIYYLGKPAVKEIRFVKVAEGMIPASLKDGSVDSASIPSEAVDDIEDAGFTVITDQPSFNGKLMINHNSNEPLSSKEFRQAIAYAIDREDLVQVALRGYATAGSPGMIPPTSVWYNPATPQYSYDPSKAQELIEDCGYTLQDGQFVKNGEPLELSLIIADDYEDIGEFIAEQLEEIGISIDIQTLEAETVYARVSAWNFDLSICGHGGLFEPSFLQWTIIGGGYNSARYYADYELTQLLNDQLTEMDTAERKDMIFEIQVLYAEDMPALTLYYPESYWAHDGSLSIYYTMDGIASGVPIPLNRMCFVQ